MRIVTPTFAFFAGPSFIDLKRGETVQSLRFEQGDDTGSFNGIPFQMQALQFGQALRLSQLLQTGIGHSIFIEVEVLDILQIEDLF